MALHRHNGPQPLPKHGQWWLFFKKNKRNKIGLWDAKVSNLESLKSNIGKSYWSPSVSSLREHYTTADWEITYQNAPWGCPVCDCRTGKKDILEMQKIVAMPEEIGKQVIRRQRSRQGSRDNKEKSAEPLDIQCLSCSPLYIYIDWLTSLNKKPLMVETSSCQYDTSSSSMGLPLLDLGFSNLPIDAWTILYDLFRFRTLERELGFWRDWLHNNWSNW